MSFIDFYVPGIVAYAIILTCFNTTALGFAALRANGVLKRLRVTPLPWWVFVAGTVGSTLLVVTLSIAIMLAVGIMAFGAHLPPARCRASCSRWCSAAPASRRSGSPPPG